MRALEPIAGVESFCGEGVLWDFRRNRVLWTDPPCNRVYQLDPSTGKVSVLCHGLRVSGIALQRKDQLILSGARGLHLWGPSSSSRVRLSEHQGEALFLGQVVADPWGGVYAGSTYWGGDGWDSRMEKYGKLYRIAPDGTVRILDEGLELSNGMAFSPDDRTFYFTDFAARRVYACDVSPRSGELSNKRTFVRVPRDEGCPGQLAVDREGFVWTPQWYGAQVVRYDPEGRVERRIGIPAQQVSGLAFGGDDLAQLYVATARQTWTSDLAPPGYEGRSTDAGGPLYRIELDVPGRPPYVADLPWE